MTNTLGIDLGTNSIGLALNEEGEFTWYGVYTFKKGVGDGKSGEFSLAAERTSHRSTRRLYNSRRYRKWETLRVLINNGYCPLPLDKLNKWKHYKKGIGRVFPANDKEFNQWIKLDFNGDGKPDYSSPYQLRKELSIQNQNLDSPIDRMKLGRALYHIAQRRGFKSSRKIGANEKTAVYKGSNNTKTIGRNDYESLLLKHSTLGVTFAHLEDKGVRIRNRYTLRSDYHHEVETILRKQNLLESDFGTSILKAIFFQRPLRSQKGLVGKCTLEPSKTRCPVSHPRFELYRAWSFVNNIKYRTPDSDTFQSLPLELKKELIQEKLFLKGNKTEFSKIRSFICKNERVNWELNYKTNMDKVSLPTCSISSYFREAFGEDWQEVEIQSNKQRTNKKGEAHSVSYSMQDLWHILFSFEDEEYLDEFLLNDLALSDAQAKELKNAWNKFPVGYANLSLKAINNILPFLETGIIYSEAVFLAKIPEIIGRQLFEDNEQEIIEALTYAIDKNRHEKTIANITNNLIANYKALREHVFAYKDFDYKLDASDKQAVKDIMPEYFGNRWTAIPDEEKEVIIHEVEKSYQDFFHDQTRAYRKLPKLVTEIENFLFEHFHPSSKDLKKLYHPSMTEIYPSHDDQEFLGSPKTGAFKNPMAYKTLYKLQHVINDLLEKGIINNETRIVVEIARELNDKNKRAAIEDYQRARERENLEYGIAIAELLKDTDFSGVANAESSKDRDKMRLWAEQSLDEDFMGTIQKAKSDIHKYRLWKEQKAQCFYSGKMISITDLFDKNRVDFEHTIPRSKSFDNSLANLTVCYANYNRNEKGNKIPTELPNYETDAKGYTAIKPRLKPWEEKITSLEEKIDFQVYKSRTAMDKASKDSAIRKRHVLKMELDYWKNKLDRFTREDVPLGFRNSQLVDTQIISKYAYHYLKTVFNHVEVIKGQVTSEFRTIYDIQPKNERKDRSTHVHHVIDAAVLTLLPNSALRKEILEKKYLFEEKYNNKTYHEKPYEGFSTAALEEIKDEILINNIKDQDRTLMPAKKKVRKRGKVQYLKDKSGQPILDKNGQKIPMYSKGDTVRGQLHLDSFYGKIKIAAKDDKGSLLRDNNGQIIFNQVSGEDEVWMVKRKPITEVNFNTDVIVDSYLAKHIDDQVAKGIEAHQLKDFNGKIIRRIRCRSKKARGFLDPKNVTILKKQTYTSSKEYKNYYYTDSGENYLFGLYENENGRKIVSINLLEAAQYASDLDTTRKEELFQVKEPILIGRGKKAKEGKLIHIFQPGQKVLFYLEDKEELREIEENKEELSKRLYFVQSLADAKNQRILFQFHKEARTNDELSEAFPKSEFGTKGKDGFSSFQNDFQAPRLLLTPTNFHFIIEEKDFTFSLDGDIEFKY